jgi:hypothetical protein
MIAIHKNVTEAEIKAKIGKYARLSKAVLWNILAENGISYLIQNSLSHCKYAKGPYT